jgi:membrane protease YdiL (CAAX protease family)
MTRVHLAAVVEVTALTALVLSYIWGWQGAFPGSALLLVVLYFGIGIASHLRRGESARQIGFRLDNWRAAFRGALIAGGIASFLFLALGAALDTWHFPSVRQSMASLPWMVAWGTAQQYGLVCFLYQRLLEILQGPRAATLGAAMLFAIFHVPNPLLLAVTLVAGVVSCTLYRRAPNVFVLGIAHAAVSFVVAGALPFSLTHRMHVGPGYFAVS